MKQEKASSELKVATVLPTSTRHRASPKAKDSPKPEVSPGLKARSRSISVSLSASESVPSPDQMATQKVRRALGLSKPKSSEDFMTSQKGRVIEEVKTLGRSGNHQVMEHFVRPRRRVADQNSKKNEDVMEKEKKDLLERLSCSEILVQSLQSEVSELKTQLENLQNLNVELVSKNKMFAEDLAIAEAKISAISSHDQGDSTAAKLQASSFKDVQKLIASKLENMGGNKNVREGSSTQIPSTQTSKPVIKVYAVQPKVPVNSVPPSAMPPPPPPPPLPRVPSRTSTAKRTPSLVEFYHTLTKRQERKDVQVPAGIHNNRVATNAHNSIVGEIQNRSAHLIAIKLDVETKGEFIKSLIEKIQAAAYTDIEDVSKFVDWIDRELSSLADERAVLKHFHWPERKADAMREAAIEYRDLKRLESEVSSYKYDSSMPCEASLKKIASLLDKCERNVQRLIKLRNSTMLSYQECRIPIDWMQDSGMVYKIKKASMKLAKMYMERVSMEVQSVRNSERESTQEALLLQGVRFAYRTHQFAGGLDSETMCAFEEIRQRVPTSVGGSRELLPGIAS